MNGFALRGFTLRSTLGAVVTITTLLIAHAPINAQQLPRLLMILDASISMEDKIGNELKYKLVRKAMGKALPAYESKLKTGLITFGRNDKASCKDVSRLVDLKPLNPKALALVINNIKPKGKSPIGASLAVAADMAKINTNPVHMLLMADGSDNCNADICATAKLIAKHSPQTRIHVIGVGKAAIVKRLSCVSKVTNGIFTAVASSDEMTTAMNAVLQTVVASKQPAKSTSAIIPNPLSLDPKTGEETAREQTTTFPKTVPLPVRPTRKRKAKAIAPAEMQMQQVEQQLALAQPQTQQIPKPAPTPAASDQRLTNSDRMINDKGQANTEHLDKPKPSAQDNADPRLWRKITEQPTYIAEAPQPVTTESVVPEPVISKPATPAKPAISKPVAPTPSPIEPPAKKPTAPAPTTKFLGAKPTIEITLPEASAKIKLRALITEQGKPIESGLIWRIYKSKKEENGRYKLVKSLEAPLFDESLPLGVYLVNLSWGRSHLTEKMDILSSKPFTHNFVLNAGGLRLGAHHLDGSVLPSSDVIFRIYSEERDQFGKRRLIIDKAKSTRTIRLNAGIYHVVSLYGTANGLVETDITIEAGKLTDAVINHTASKVTLKLVDQPGGEALAGAIWRVSSPDGELIKETAGALPSIILAAGDYTINASYSGRTFARKMTIEPGNPVSVEIVIQ